MIAFYSRACSKKNSSLHISTKDFLSDFFDGNSKFPSLKNYDDLFWSSPRIFMFYFKLLKLLSFSFQHSHILKIHVLLPIFPFFNQSRNLLTQKSKQSALTVYTKLPWV